MKNTLIDLYLLGGVAALAGILALLALLVNFGIKKLKWEKVRAVLTAAWSVLDTVTREANAELVAKLKVARGRNSDGGTEITEAEWHEARKAAVAKFKRLWGLDKLAILADSLGLGLDVLDDWIAARIGGGLDPK